MNSHKTSILKYAALITVCICTSAQAIEITAKDVLTSALTKMADAKTSIKSSKYEKNVGKVTVVNDQTIYQRLEADGTRLQRIESIAQVKRKDGGLMMPVHTCVIENRKGSWIIDETKMQAIKFAPMAAAENGIGGITTALNGDENRATYEIGDSNAISGVPCYKVTIHLNLNTDMKGIVKDAIVKTKASFVNETQPKPATKKPVEPPLPEVAVYHIGKSDGVLYGNEIFTAKGEKISSQLCYKVQLNTPIDDNKFELPNACTQVTVNSINELVGKIITR